MREIKKTNNFMLSFYIAESANSKDRGFLMNLEEARG